MLSYATYIYSFARSLSSQLMVWEVSCADMICPVLSGTMGQEVGVLCYLSISVTVRDLSTIHLRVVACHDNASLVDRVF